MGRGICLKEKMVKIDEMAKLVILLCSIFIHTSMRPVFTARPAFVHLSRTLLYLRIS